MCANRNQVCIILPFALDVLGTTMGARTSSFQQKADSSFSVITSTVSFEELPIELRLFLFALLPFESLVRCIQMNKSSYDIITSNWTSMKRYDGIQLELSILIYSKGSSVSLELFSDKSQSQEAFVVDVTADTAEYRLEPANKDFLPEKDTKYSFEKPAVQLKESVSETSISSIPQNMQLHLKFLFQRVKFRCIKIFAIARITKPSELETEYVNIVLNMMNKYYVKTPKVPTIALQISSKLVDTMMAAGCNDIELHSSVFESNYLVSRLASSVKSLFIVKYEPSTENEGGSTIGNIRNLFKSWANGNFGAIESLELIVPRDEAHEYYKSISDIFKCQLTFVPRDFGEKTEMEFTVGTKLITMELISSINILEAAEDFRIRIK